MQNKLNNRGFSLVEIIIVSLMISLIFLILFGTLNSLITARDVIENEYSVQRSISSFLSKFRRELINARAENLFFFDNRSGQSNFTKFYAKNNNNGEQSFSFVSNATGLILFNDNPNYGSVQINYFVQKNNETEKYDLIREEYQYNPAKPEFIERTIKRYPVLIGAKKINFRFLRNSDWLNDWQIMPSSSVGGGRETDQILINLPLAIEVYIESEDSSGNLKIFHTASQVGFK